MTNEGNGLGVIGIRLTQLEDAQRAHDQRIEQLREAVIKLGYLPQQVGDLRRSIEKLESAIDRLAEKQQAREQWVQDHQLGADSAGESRMQNVRSGMLTVIGLGLSIAALLVSTLVTLLLRKA